MLEKILKSWSNWGHPVHTQDELLAWIQERNLNLTVNIVRSSLSHSECWFYDDKSD